MFSCIYHQSIDFPELFAGGDCICLQGCKTSRVGVHAVRQSPVLHHNLLAALDGGEMKVYIPREDYMLILNMGDSKGILFKCGRTWSGRVVFLLKDFIDRRFVRRFRFLHPASPPDNQFQGGGPARKACARHTGE